MLKLNATRFTILATVFATLIPVGFYIWRFRLLEGLKDISKNPADFGVFGDFIGGTTNVILGVINVFLVAYIAFTLGKIERDGEEKKFLLMLLRDWNSRSMMLCRTKADKLIRIEARKSLEDLDTQYTDKVAPLWTVLVFFVNLQMYIDKSVISSKDAVELFGNFFTWYDVVAVKGQYPKHWRDASAWEKFRKSVSNRPGYKDWSKVAEADLKSYLQNSAPAPAAPQDTGKQNDS